MVAANPNSRSGIKLDPAAHGMGAPKGSNGDRLGRLCASNDHLHSTIIIRNHRPRIKQIWILSAQNRPDLTMLAFRGKNSRT